MKNQILPFKLQRPVFLICSLFYFNKAVATTYTFHGGFDSRWSFSWNWSAPSYKPPSTLPAGDNIIIAGTCNIDEAVTCNGTIGYSGNFAVTISSSLNIGSGGSVTTANLTNNGTIRINGLFVTNTPFTNNGTFIINSAVGVSYPVANNNNIQISTGASLTIYNSGMSSGSLVNGSGKNIAVNGQLIFNQTGFINDGQVAVAAGGLINCVSGAGLINNSTISNAGTINIGSSCNLNNAGAISNLNGGLLKGDGTFIHNWIYDGQPGSVISPGASNTGKLSITGISSNNILGNSAYLCDVNGTNPGVNSDLLTLSNTAMLSSATLTVNWGSFVPSAGQNFTILTCANRVGQFASVHIPPVAGRVFSVVYNSNSVVIQTSAILPLHLLYFSGNCTAGNEANLIWQTTNEMDLYGYEVQLSEDEVNFYKAGFSPAKNSSSVENYHYTLPQKNTRAFYRLKMIDKNGQFTYSNIIVLFNAARKNTINLYPNPANHTIYIENKTALKNVVLQIIDAAGKVLLQQQYGIDLKLAIDVTKLPAGAYTVNLFYDSKLQYTEKLIKQ